MNARTPSASRYSRGSYAHARLPYYQGIGGFAVASSGVYLSTWAGAGDCGAGAGLTCDIQRTAVAFASGRDSYDG